MDSLRVELAQKYYAMAETKPDLKVDLFGSGQHNEVDMNRIQKVNVFKAKNDVILCAVTIDGADKLQPRVVSPSQWQRMWIAEDKNEYKSILLLPCLLTSCRKDRRRSRLHQKSKLRKPR